MTMCAYMTNENKYLANGENSEFSYGNSETVD